MASRTLTDKLISHLTPKPQQYAIFDDKVKGLALRISPGGTKSFAFQYRFQGINCRTTLGQYGVITLAEARMRGKELQVSVARGIDPRKTKNRTQPNDAAMAIPALVEDFIENYAKRKTKSWSETARILNNEFSHPWSKRQAKEIKKQDIHQLLNGVNKRSGPSAANHAFAIGRKFFNWLIEQGHLEYSPFFGMKKPATTKSRERVLTESELTNVLKGCQQMGYPFGPYVMLLAATAQRRTEVSSLAWTDLDLNEALWDQTKNKTSQPQCVPLNDFAIATLSQVARLHDRFLFPARGKDNPMTGFSKWKKQLDLICEVTGWTLHDLRRTAATGMARLKVPEDTIERVLNHKSSRMSGIAGVYNRYDYLDEKRLALELWGRHLSALLAPALVDELTIMPPDQPQTVITA